MKRPIRKPWPLRCPNSSGTRWCGPRPWAGLGVGPEGARALEELLQLRPYFAAAGPFLISCYAKFPNLVADLLDGLRLQA